MKRAYMIALISALGGVLVHLMVLLVIQVEMPGRRTAVNTPTSIHFVGQTGKSTSESFLGQAALNDSAPLFMPTVWNSASDLSRVACLQAATRIFEPFPPQLALLQTRPSEPLDCSGTMEPIDSRLPDGAAFYMARFGRVPPGPARAVSPGPNIRVELIGNAAGDPSLIQRIPEDLAGIVPLSLWNPIKMFLHLENGTPVGLPLLSQSSGFAEWDIALQQYFQELEFYHPLKDGYYQIWVYP